MTCAYCGNEAVLVTGDALYPTRPDLYQNHFYRCDPCQAHVGCHPGTTNPLGRLANAELRKAKMDAHAIFDLLWRTGKRSRRQAYAWLAHELGIDISQCHIGEFDLEQCRRVVEICRATKKRTESR